MLLLPVRSETQEREKGSESNQESPRAIGGSLFAQTKELWDIARSQLV